MIDTTRRIAVLAATALTLGITHAPALAQGSGEPVRLIEWALTAAHVTVKDERKNGARIQIDSTDSEIIAGVLRRLINDGLPVVEFHREERNLEDAFIDILGKLESGAKSTAAPVAAGQERGGPA